MNRAVGRIKPDLRMVAWNPDGFKIGLCSVPPTGASHSVLCLANNTAITGTFKHLRERFAKIYRRKAHIHHYTEFMDEHEFQLSLEALDSLTDDYASYETTGSSAAPVSNARMIPAV